jgi:hypothetical protein
LLVGLTVVVQVHRGRIVQRYHELEADILDFLPPPLPV